jgi:sugar phosphate permease
MSGIHDNDRGAASGLVNTAHQLGGSVGLALLTVVFGAANAQSAEGYSSVFTVATAFYVLAVPAVGVVLVAQRQGST